MGLLGAAPGPVPAGIDERGCNPQIATSFFVSFLPIRSVSRHACWSSSPVSRTPCPLPGIFFFLSPVSLSPPLRLLPFLVSFSVSFFLRLLASSPPCLLAPCLLSSRSLPGHFSVVCLTSYTPPARINRDRDSSRRDGVRERCAESSRG